MSWKRPENVPFPSVWSRFEGKRPINGKIPKFWIQDIPEDMFDTAVEFMSKDYIYNEPLCKFSNLIEDVESVNEVKALWKVLIEQKLGLICFMENSDGNKIVAGLNLTCLSVKGNPPFKYNGKTWKKVNDSVMYICNLTDPYDMFGINEFMNGMGLSVLPEFRGQGIGEALLQARTPLCKAIGLKVTLTVFTNTISQNLAVKVGFKDLVSITYENLEKENPKFKYPGISEHTKSMRYMYKLI